MLRVLKDKVRRSKQDRKCDCDCCDRHHIRRGQLYGYIVALSNKKLKAFHLCQECYAGYQVEIEVGEHT